MVGIMLEAFCDLTDFPALADHEAVQAVYEPWHQLEEESVSGNLLTNIFAGGTVDTEWGFLTGYSQHQDFTKATDSYVWYFARQGYQTRGGHPGFGWFYDRENVNRYLGFQEYWFTDNHYGELVDPVEAQWNSDYILTGEIVKDLQAQLEESRRPVFSFSVSYQNHGPYEWTYTANETYLDPETSGLPEESCYVFNNYLHGVNITISAMTLLAQQLEEMEEPVVLVFFGDHLPYLGDNQLAYAELGFTARAEWDALTSYETPYVIWANDAAAQALDWEAAVASLDLPEDGRLSASFLGAAVLELTGRTGESPWFDFLNQLRRELPVVQKQAYQLADGTVTDQLTEEQAAKIAKWRQWSYYKLMYKEID